MSTPALRVTLDPTRVDLGAGRAASVTVTIRNVGRTVQHVAVRVAGLPDGATYRPVPEAVKLLPAAEATVALELRLPAAPPVAAGTHVLGIVCHSTHDPSVSRCEEVRLAVEPAPGLTLAFDRQLVRSVGQGRFVATVANTGNTTLTVGLRAKDPEGRMRLEFTPPAVTLAPRQQGHTVLAASAPTVWTGQERQHAVRVDATADGASAADTVTLVQRPRVPAGALRLVGGTAGLLVLAGAVAGGLVLAGRDDAGVDDPAATAGAATGPTADATTPGAGETTPPGSTADPTTPGPTDEATDEPTDEATDDATGDATDDTTTEPEPVERTEGFAGVQPGTVDGVFDGFRVSTAPPGDTCPGTGLLAERDGDDGVLTAAATEASCRTTPLLVLFDPPAQRVVLEVPDEALVPGAEVRYGLRVDDVTGGVTLRTVLAPDGRIQVPASADLAVRSVILSLDDPTDDPAGDGGVPRLALSGVVWVEVEE